MVRSSEKKLVKVPTHVAIIMDGNGRWATQRNLPRLAGHRAGTENLRRVIRAAAGFGIEYLTFYAFSTENWSRPEDEVKGLLKLLSDFIDKEMVQLHKEGARLLHIGHLDGLGPMLEQKVRDAIELTKDNKKISVVLAFNYGGRDEILTAIRKMMAEGVSPDELDEKLFGTYLFTSNIPDPDLVIRTSGEQRTSNFLVWQSVYSEWAFPDAFWPNFNEDMLYEILVDYGNRDRRFGGLSTSSKVKK
ncbi:MAG: polyprenyl diphosphate synthase [Anaerolineaceae bacterium]|nr:polyprenyl diphosphate synthase [Anaerolineaceae bacterium]